MEERKLFSGGPVTTLIWTNDESRSVRYVSENIFPLLGYTQMEFYTPEFSFMELIHPEDRDRIRREANDYQQKGVPFYEQTYRVKSKNGTYRWFSDYTRPVREGGATVSLQGYLVDLTRQKEAEVALLEAKERFELAVNGTNDGIFDWDIQSGYLFLSRRWKEILGYKEEELPNELSTFYELLYEEDREIVSRKIKDYLEGRLEYYAFEFRMKHKDGTIRWILAKGEAVRGPDGKPCRMAGSHSDITHKKEAERALQENKLRLELAMDAGEHGFWDWNLLTNETYFSPSYYTMLGYQDQELPMNFSTFVQLLHPEDMEKVMPSVEESVRQGTPYQVEFRLRAKDGNYRWIQGKGKTYFSNESGKPLRAVGVHVDIHEKKVAEKKLEAAKYTAEEASKAKSEFLANMSHEIRTPLNGVIGFTDLLLKTSLDTIQEEYAQNANISGKLLLSILKDILDFSKIEAGKLELDIMPAELGDLLEEAADIVKYQASQNGLDFLVDIPPDMPPIVWVDPVRLRQIVINLLNNAIKFTDQGEVVLTVRFSPLREGIGQYTISVQDTGIGILPEQKERLFSPFYQGDSTPSRRHGGTGLGLTISSLIAKEMGSSIQVESRYGQGSEFSLSLELAYDKHSLPSVIKTFPWKKALVVEENPKLLKIIANALSYQGISCTFCRDGHTALRLIQEKELDLVIMAYWLPDMAGMEAIDKIRKERRGNLANLPVLMMHTINDDLRSMDGLEMHRMARISKPVTPSKLFRALRNLEESLEKDNCSHSNLKADQPYKGMLEAEKPLQKVNIVIAEDVPLNLTLAKILIQRALPDANILEAQNGHEVIAVFQKEPVDLIFMDIQMPEMDGLEATRKIRSMEIEGGTQIPIIALTAGAFQEQKEMALGAGMDDFLTKPIEVPRLEAMLKKYLPK